MLSRLALNVHPSNMFSTCFAHWYFLHALEWMFHLASVDVFLYRNLIVSLSLSVWRIHHDFFTIDGKLIPNVSQECLKSKSTWWSMHLCVEITLTNCCSSTMSASSRSFVPWRSKQCTLPVVDLRVVLSEAMLRVNWHCDAVWHTLSFVCHMPTMVFPTSIVPSDRHLPLNIYLASVDKCWAWLLLASLKSARFCERKYARTTHDLNSVMNSGKSCASLSRRSIWSYVCLTPGVVTAFDFFVSSQDRQNNFNMAEIWLYFPNFRPSCSLRLRILFTANCGSCGMFSQSKSTCSGTNTWMQILFRCD